MAYEREDGGQQGQGEQRCRGNAAAGVIGPFRSGSVLDQRERSVGFNGVGGSFMSNPMQVVRGKAIKMVDQPSTGAPYSEVPQIAELPDALIQK